MSGSVIDRLQKLTPARVHAWIIERLENACRLASQKSGADRDGWLDDAAYLAGASTLILKAIDAKASIDVEAVRGSTVWPAAPVQTEATPQEKLDFLAGECRKALAVMERLPLAAYFQAIADNDPHARALDQIGDFIRPTLHVLGCPTFTEETCPGHVASPGDPKVCDRCGVHIDSCRPDDDEAA